MERWMLDPVGAFVGIIGIALAATAGCLVLMTALHVVAVATQRTTDVVTRRLLPRGLLCVLDAVLVGVLPITARAAVAPTGAAADPVRTTRTWLGADPSPTTSELPEPEIDVADPVEESGPDTPVAEAGPEGFEQPDDTSPPRTPAVQTPTVAPAPAPAHLYLVRPGDCLWRIAARRLGPGATPAMIDRAWRIIYSENRAVIGARPHLIRPGQRLVLPAAEALR